MKNKTTIFSELFIRKICTAVKKNRPIREEFTVWGRIHIDRSLPFLCIYRRPVKQPDKGTKELLLGQASYILIREEDAACTSFKALVKAIMENLSTAFGACLLFELWSKQEIENQSAEQETALFNIKTTERRAPKTMLEELETALLAIPFKTRNSEVSLSYSRQCSPPSMSPIIGPDELDESGLFWVGLSINPVYRQDEKRLPYMLRHLRHWLTQALQRSFYSFTRQYTKDKPGHFHELGRRSMTQAVWDTDKELAKIKEQFDILLHVTPVNNYEAWQAFKQSGFTKIPEFNYRPRPIDPDLLKRTLYAIPIERVEDPTLAYIFHSQRDEIDRQLTMINDRNNRNFLYGSLQVYGGVEPWLLALAQQLLDKLPVEIPSTVDRYMSAKEFVGRAEQILAQYRRELPELTSRIEIRDDVPGVLVSQGNLMVDRHNRFPHDTAEATLAHEVGTHMVTHINGKMQPFHQFYSGMRNYEPLQEGLAVMSEYLVGQLKSGRVRTLAARVIAVHSLIDGGDFIDTFTLLHDKFDFSPYQAYYITMRVFRGGGFTKDAVYLKGLSRLLNYLSKGGELDILYLGKIAQEDIPFVEELRWRKIINTRLLLPHYLKTEQSQQRLNSIRQGISLVNLIKEG